MSENFQIEFNDKFRHALLVGGAVRGLRQQRIQFREAFENGFALRKALQCIARARSKKFSTLYEASLMKSPKRKKQQNALEAKARRAP